MITSAEASAIIDSLEVATEAAWPQFVQAIKARGVDISILRSGWEKLEKMSVYCDMVPCEEDFDW